MDAVVFGVKAERIQKTLFVIMPFVLTPGPSLVQ